MREKKSAMDAASDELERRSRYLSSLIQRTKLKSEEEEKEKGKEEEEEEEVKEEGDPQEQRNVKVRAADMSLAMQRKAFRCAREVMKEMTKLDSKKLALALKKLHVPGCTNLTADGVVRAVKWLTEHKGCVESLRIRGLRNIGIDHLDLLKSLVFKRNVEQVPQQYFYGNWHSLPPNSDDRRLIDVDICPKCTNIRLVFDCTRENCRTMKDRWSECRGCFFCIARCEDCGGCIDSDYIGDETACSHLLCLECWLRLPKCNLCNRPYCFGHEKGSFASNSTSGFVCEHCNEETEALTNDIN